MAKTGVGGAPTACKIPLPSLALRRGTNMRYKIVIIDDAGDTECLANATDDTEFFDTEAVGRLISYLQSGLPSDVQSVSLIRTTDADGFPARSGT